MAPTPGHPALAQRCAARAQRDAAGPPPPVVLPGDAPGTAVATPESPMSTTSHATALVARRYLEHGFLDAALRLFLRHPAAMAAGDWTCLVERLMARGRITDAVRACSAGGVPLPRERLLAVGDRARWAQLVDGLTALPTQERRALELAHRHLVPDAAARPLAAAS